MCRVLACKVAATSVVPGQVIGEKWIDQNLSLGRLDAKWGMAKIGASGEDNSYETALISVNF